MKIGDIEIGKTRVITPINEGVIQGTDCLTRIHNNKNIWMVLVNDLWWDSRVLTPIEPSDYAARLQFGLGLLDLWDGEPLEEKKTGIYICDHATGCHHATCAHVKKHHHIGMCDIDKNSASPCKWLNARCIPYVKSKLKEKPQLMICKKASTCKLHCIAQAKEPHKWNANCGVACEEVPCITYVEPEEKDWFVVDGDTPGWFRTSGLGDTKERCLELIKARPSHDLRAFRWSDGER